VTAVKIAVGQVTLRGGAMPEPRPLAEPVSRAGNGSRRFSYEPLPTNDSSARSQRAHALSILRFSESRRAAPEEHSVAVQSPDFTHETARCSPW